MRVSECETAVIWNPSAGTAELYSALRRELERVPGIVLRETESDAEAREFVRRSVDGGTQLVIAAGGDGTLNAVVNELAVASNPATLAILPVGTGNDFARTLAIPQDAHEALALLHDPRIRNLDLLKVEDPAGSRYFINMANGGNSQNVVLDDELKQRWGPFCYVRGVIEVLTRLETYKVAIRFDEGPAETFDVFNIFLGNGQTCGAGLKVAPLADPEDGLMDVMIVRDGGPVDVATLAARFLVNDFLDSEMVVHRQARTVRIDSDPKMAFVADGDANTVVPATFTVIPAALPVVVGPDYMPPHPESSREETRAATIE